MKLQTSLQTHSRPWISSILAPFREVVDVVRDRDASGELDFLGLNDRYLERDLEDAILREMEQFLLELGAGFTFVARQKRLLIDDDDFYLDLLFYNRKLRCLVAIELKLGTFKAEYKSQMELYLRWLARHEQEPDEAADRNYSVRRQETGADRTTRTGQERNPRRGISDRPAAP
jgi:hypothetical protein